MLFASWKRLLTLYAPKPLSLCRVGSCRTSGGGAAPGRRRRRRRDLTGAAEGRTPNARNIYRRYIYGHLACPARLRHAVGVSPRTCVLRCLARVCAWAVTGVPDGHATGRVDGFLRTGQVSPTPGSCAGRRCCITECADAGTAGESHAGTAPNTGSAGEAQHTRSRARPDSENNCALVR